MNFGGPLRAPLTKAIAPGQNETGKVSQPSQGKNNKKGKKEKKAGYRSNAFANDQVGVVQSNEGRSVLFSPGTLFIMTSLVGREFCDIC